MTRTVLVADDNLTIQRMATEMLSQEDIEVVTVANGMAAIKKLPSVKPLVVLADANMPGKDGYEVCNFVKSSPEFGHVRALLVVGDEEPYDEERGGRARVDGIIKKPFDRWQLVAVVAECLSQAAMLAPAEGKAVDAPAASHGSSLCSAGVSDVRSPMDSIGVQKSDPTAEVGDGDSAATVGRLEEWPPGAADGMAFFSEPGTGPEAANEIVAQEINAVSEISFEPAGEPLWIDEPETPESVAAVDVLAKPAPEPAEFRNSGDIKPPPTPPTTEFPEGNGEKLDEPRSAPSWVDRDLVASVVTKAVARMAPSALSAEMILELERTLTEEILFDLSSDPAES